MRALFVSLRGKLAACAASFVMAAAAFTPVDAVAHGALDYHVIEYHYVRIGPFTQTMPYAQRNYYCDGHYEYIPGPGGSLGLAFTQTYDDGPC
jgi:hypothetical protein